MRAGLRRLGLSALAAEEFINNGIDSIERLRLLSKEDLDRLIKQIHRDNAVAGGAGIFIPFISQTYIHAVHFWTNRMYILGEDFDETLIDADMARAWATVMRDESDASELKQM
jgi:LPS O-antigen subunit length determinant protein (WzzB/FepE family)